MVNRFELLLVAILLSMQIYTIICLFFFFTLTHNVLALGAVADYGAQNCQYTTKVDAR